MPSKSGIKAGRAYVELGVNDAFTRGLTQAKKQLAAFGAGLTQIGVGFSAVSAGILAPLSAAVLKFSDSGDQVAKMAQRIGIGGEALQELGHAADLSGADMESLETGLRKMQKTLDQSADGSKEATESLAKLGLTVADLQGKSPDEQFRLIADKIAGISDPTRKTAAAMEIFGKSGTKLIPLLNEGAAGIQKMQDRFKALGAELSSDELKAAEELNDRLGDLRTSLAGVANHIAAAVAPAISAFAAKVTGIVASASRWIQENGEVVRSIAKIGLAIGAAGAAFLALGGTLTVISIAIGGFISAWGAVMAVAGAVGSAIAALASPLGILVTALVGTAAALIYFSGVGNTALQWLRDNFASLRSFVGEVIGGISDALAAGDIALAAKVLWAGLTVAWEAGTLALRKIWETAKGAFLGFFTDMWAGALKIMEVGTHALEVGWIETTSFLSKGWSQFTSFMTETWLTVVNLIQKAWNTLKGLFDSTFDSAAENLKADQALVDKLAASQKTAGAEQAAIEQQREQRRDVADKVHAGALEEISKQQVDALAKISDEGKAKIEAAQGELDKAGEAFKAARATAKDKAAAAKDLPDIDVAKKRELDQAGFATRDKLTSAGSFSLASLSSLSGNENARTAKATETMAAHLAVIKRKIELRETFG